MLTGKLLFKKEKKSPTTKNENFSIEIKSTQKWKNVLKKELKETGLLQGTRSSWPLGQEYRDLN